MNDTKTYKIYKGHWNYATDSMDDEKVSIIHSSNFNGVFSFCEELAHDGFDITCEVFTNGEWTHAFCLNAEPEGKEYDNRQYQIFTSKIVGMLNSFAVEEDAFGNPICHTFIMNYKGAFREVEDIALRISETIDPRYTVVIRDLDANSYRGETTHYIF